MRRIFFLLFALAVAGGGYWWITTHQPADAQARGQGRHMNDAIPVVLATAETRDVPIYLDGLGTVQASATVTVKPQVDGTLTEVRYHEGQDVHAGDVLAVIDPRTYQAALDQAVAKKRQDEANLANARTDLTRYQKLAATAYTSAQQADTQKALVAQLEAQVAQDQAQIDTAKTQLSYTTITSPIDGRVGIRQVDAGNLVHASDTTGLVVITTLKPISVMFTLPQQSLGAVSEAMQAGAPEALALPQLATGLAPAGSQAPQARAPIDRGTLTVLDNQVDQTTGTIKLKATFPNEKLQLWPGAFVTVRVRIDTQHNVVVVPPVAIQRGPQGAYVYVVGDDMTASRRPVQISHEDERAVIVAEGLASGERVVVDGAARLTDKAKVTIVQPSGTTPGGGPRTSGPETASRHPHSGPT